MKPELKAWVITADMGYGHQRAAHSLGKIAEGGIITAGAENIAAPSEKKLWNRLLGIYEFFSRISSIPVIGKPIFNLLDVFLRIPPLYPTRDLSASTFQVNMLISFIKKGLCAGMLKKIGERNLPIVTSFFAPAIAADLNKHKNIYCIVCDADLNRVWVAKKPDKSRINYFAPCEKAAQRLKAYGVPEERIFVTGFPLSDKLLGGMELSILKADLGQRLHYLDPNNRFFPLHNRNVEYFLGKDNCIFKNERKLTITYAVGGAGAQKEIGRTIAFSLEEKLARGEVKLNLAAGTRKDVKEYYEKVRNDLHGACKNIEVIFEPEIYNYFESFNKAIRSTDILWTKPSELSFYSGLGLPVIITSALGSQETFNKRWLTEINAGIKQLSPVYTHQWLFDLLNDGRLADAAWSGFLKARKLGVYKILEVLQTGKMEREDSLILR